MVTPSKHKKLCFWTYLWAVLPPQAWKSLSSGHLKMQNNNNIYQQFSDRCYKLCFISTQLNIRSLLQKQDKAIFQKAKQHENHPLKVCLLQEKNSLTHNLRHKSFQRPKINTKRYKNTFVNRLIFKYSILWYFMSDMCN